MLLTTTHTTMRVGRTRATTMRDTVQAKGMVIMMSYGHAALLNAGDLPLLSGQVTGLTKPVRDRMDEVQVHQTDRSTWRQ